MDECAFIRATDTFSKETANLVEGRQKFQSDEKWEMGKQQHRMGFNLDKCNVTLKRNAKRKKQVGVLVRGHRMDIKSG